MASIFDNPFGMTQYGSTMGDIRDAHATRQKQIDDFAGTLSGLRQQYMNQIPQLNQAAFKQFGADAAAGFAGTGQTTSSGAFQEALAKYAIPMQANMFNTAYNTGTAGAGAVDAARAGAYGVFGNSLSSALAAPTSSPLGGALFGMALGLPGKAFQATSGGMGQPGPDKMAPTEAESGMAMAAA